jgi:UDP-2-acetamido-3-amino-2,3-dideoxy-glucuronate N-acetyltransferase
MCKRIASSASVGQGCLLGENTIIEEDVIIGDGSSTGHGVIIQAGVRIGKRVTIGHNVVIYPGTEIGNGVDIRDNSVLGRLPKSSAISTRKVERELPPLRIGDHSMIGACVVLYAGTKVGVGVLIADMASIRELCDVKDYAIVGRGVVVEYETIIGEHSKIQSGCHITGNMIIEDHVFLGPEVTTANDPYMDRVKDEFKGPHVKRGARIGSNATLLPEVVIGEEAVVTAGAIVGTNVPARRIAAGPGARLIGDVPQNELLYSEVT